MQAAEDPDLVVEVLDRIDTGNAMLASAVDPVRPRGSSRYVQ